MRDNDIIKDLQSGNPEAYKILVGEHQVSLFKLCMGFLHNTEDARDIVQETFIEVFESVHNFRRESKLSTWLYRIAINKSLNLIRKRKLRNWLVNIDFISGNRNSVEVIQPAADSADNADYSVESEERKKLVKKAIDTLPDNQRIAFILNKYQGLSYNEVSEVMAISISATESLIYRAKEALQKKLYTFYKKNLL